MEDVDYIKDRVIKKVHLMRTELVEQSNNINNRTIEERVYLLKKCQSLDVFQELFFIAYSKTHNKNGEAIYSSFQEVTKSFVDSCKEHRPLEGASWTIHLETFTTISILIKECR